MAAEDTHRGSTQTDLHFRSPAPREARLSPLASPPTASVPEQFPFSALPVPTALPAKRISTPTSKASKADKPAAKIKKEERPRKPAPPKAPKQAPEPPPQPVLNRMLLQFVPAPSPYVYPTIREAKSTMAVPTYAFAACACHAHFDLRLCVPIAVLWTPGLAAVVRRFVLSAFASFKRKTHAAPVLRTCRIYTHPLHVFSAVCSGPQARIGKLEVVHHLTSPY